MTDTLEDLTKRGKELYGLHVQALAGFQIIEDLLKSYMERHFDLTRALIDGRLHFEFRREDYQEAALGRLTQVFSKLCSNQKLVSDLRAVVRRRDHIAHRALLKLYEKGITPPEYSELLDQLSSDMERITELMDCIGQEMDKLK